MCIRDRSSANCERSFSPRRSSLVREVMHDCQRFREDWIAGVAEDFGTCQDCRSFCDDARLLLQAVDGATPALPDLSETYWDRFDDRLVAGLKRENASRTYRFFWKWGSATAAAAALAAVSYTHLTLPTSDLV